MHQSYSYPLSQYHAGRRGPEKLAFGQETEPPTPNELLLWNTVGRINHLVVCISEPGEVWRKCDSGFAVLRYYNRRDGSLEYTNVIPLIPGIFLCLSSGHTQHNLRHQQLVNMTI